jgi:hypothetical protein
MEKFNTVSLFIKRAEEFQTEEFIIQAFNENNIGKVSNVKFIKKQNENGASYNGVIVNFEEWYSNNITERLLNEMSSSLDGTTKFYFNRSRYWIITVHQKKNADTEKRIYVDPSLPNEERIRQLESLVQTMACQIHYQETKLQKNEIIMMEYEQKHSRSHLLNIDLMSQLEDAKVNELVYQKETIKNRQLTNDNEEILEENNQLWLENEKLKAEIHKQQNANDELRSRLMLSLFRIYRKNIECEELREMLYVERGKNRQLELEEEDMVYLIQSFQKMKL